MANWAALQEQLMGKPVAKRAKHGIHFQNNDGSITANFSGKPCHFQDTDGLWKPIDTKLLPLGDGYYGCPHSKVKIKPDGTVSVAGTDYAQRVGLPSAQTGLVDGDKMVRTFSFGEQRMWVTEDGFKSEIQLNRIPTLTEARKLIASESGTLSKEYLKSLTTATDANGDVHTYSTLAAFRTWLAAAQFPVVIDPDFSTTSDAGDNYLYSPSGGLNYGASITLAGSPGLIRFILSSISSGETISAATMVLCKSTSAGSPRARVADVYRIAAANGDWIEGTKNGSGAGSGESCWDYKKYDTDTWAGSAGCATAGTDYIDTKLTNTVTTQRSDAQYTQYTFTFNSDGLTVLQSWFGDATNDGLRILETGAASFCSSEESTESYRPVLSVTYTAGGSGNPHYYYAQQ